MPLPQRFFAFSKRNITPRMLRFETTKNPCATDIVAVLRFESTHEGLNQ
jgi:hypothetical protein